MPYAGTFVPARRPGETKTFGVDIWKDLFPGDFLLSATAVLVVDPGNGVDPNAETLLIGQPTILIGRKGIASVIAQQIGTNTVNTGGFQPDTIYRWTFSCLTNGGDTPEWDAYITIGKAI